MDTLTARRLDWIRDLESGEKDQTSGLLCRIASDGGIGYCCIGVARENLNPGIFSDWTDYRGFNEEADYDTVSDEYGMSERLKDHLIGMNDDSQIIGDYGVLRFGSRTGKRDFPFIARFLRKVWGLTDV